MVAFSSRWIDFYSFCFCFIFDSMPSKKFSHWFFTDFFIKGIILICFNQWRLFTKTCQWCGDFFAELEHLYLWFYLDYFSGCNFFFVRLKTKHRNDLLFRFVHIENEHIQFIWSSFFFRELFIMIGFDFDIFGKWIHQNVRFRCVHKPKHLQFCYEPNKSYAHAFCYRYEEN